MKRALRLLSVIFKFCNNLCWCRMFQSTLTWYDVDVTVTLAGIEKGYHLLDGGICIAKPTMFRKIIQDLISKRKGAGHDMSLLSLPFANGLLPPCYFSLHPWYISIRLIAIIYPKRRFVLALRIHVLYCSIHTLSLCC